MTKCPQSKRTLHWVCESPSSYNDFLFQTLALSSEFDLKVHYRSAFNVHYRCQLKPDPGYSAREYESRVFDSVLFLSVLRDRESLFLTSCWQDPTCELILGAMLMMGRPYLIWNDAPIPRRRPWLKDKLRGAFLNLLFRNATKVMGTGNLALSILCKMGAPRERLLSFAYCVDLKRFVPSARLLTDKRMVLGTCARLEPIKGIDVALHALAKRTIGPFLYRIAGAGTQEKSLRELVGQLGLADSVEFCGWLQSAELPIFYQGLDVYLHPALFEPYGVAVVEALASGIPILASDQTGAALDLIANGGGLLHRAGDSEDLLRTLEAFLPLVARDGEKIKESARKAACTWTVERAVETIERVVKAR
jgi:glycosyltransferase involved in cell wall biosynthesis